MRDIRYLFEELADGISILLSKDFWIAVKDYWAPTRIAERINHWLETFK